MYTFQQGCQYCKTRTRAAVLVGCNANGKRIKHITGCLIGDMYGWIDAKKLKSVTAENINNMQTKYLGRFWGLCDTMLVDKIRIYLAERNKAFKMNIELFLLKKAVVAGHIIALGADRSVVEEMFGSGDRVDNRAYYFNSDVCVEYDDYEKVSFIEVSCGNPESTITPVIYGEDITKSDADHVLQILTEKNQGEVDSENGYSYIFYNLSVCVYREITPDDYKELIEEMKSNGDPIEDNPDVKADFWKSTHWATIGIGVNDYYR